MPAKWTDEQGREWLLEVTVPNIRKVRSATGHDLAKMFTPERLANLLSDVLQLVDVLAELTKPQWQAKGLTQDDFELGLIGAAIERATDALMQAGSDFLPPAQAAIVRGLWAKTRATSQAMEQVALATIEAAD
jgi:hypothetical protein